MSFHTPIVTIDPGPTLYALDILDDYARSCHQSAIDAALSGDTKLESLCKTQTDLTELIKLGVSPNIVLTDKQAGLTKLMIHGLADTVNKPSSDQITIVSLALSVAPICTFINSCETATKETRVMGDD